VSKENSSSIDIFGLLSDSGEKAEAEKKKARKELLESAGIEDRFAEGKITINKNTCYGLQCKLCIKACPTNALYWRQGEVGITEDLCVYCGACVLSCMVDDCIKVERKREDGRTERFSKPKDVLTLENNINARKRVERVMEVFPTADDYCEKYGQKK
jgi:NAD-dependent dihydropyrimidine dehydrogenase PreA subunit